MENGAEGKNHMMRKLIAGAAALALPLTGAAVWGGVTVANAGYPVPSLACTESGSVYLDGGGGPGTGELWLNSAGPAKLKALQAAPIGSTVVVLPGVVIPGQKVTVGGVTGDVALGFQPDAVLGEDIFLSTPTTKALLVGGSATVLATDGTNNTTPYATQTTDIGLSGSSCAGTNIDFWPTNTSFASAVPNTGNGALGLETPPASVVGQLTYPAASADWATSGSPNIVSFSKKGANTFTGTGYSFTAGVVTGTFLSKTASASVSISGMIVCTVDQLLALGGPNTPFNSCDGAGGALPTPIQAALELAAAQNGGSPNGSDGSPLLAIFRIDLAGSGTF